MRKILIWLYPGLRLKRWLVVFSAGLILAGAGFAIALDWRVYFWLGGKLQSWLYRGTGAYLSLPVQGLLVASVGVLIMGIAMERIIRWLLEVLVPAGQADLTTRLFTRRYLEHGPKVVAIGGGTGLPILLRGLKEYTANITAIVTVADDGGSSGRLRGEFGILPPGDIRNCLVALADTEGLMQELFMHRFDQGTGLAGHSFGNLFILAMTAVTGDFEEGVRKSSQVLNIRGRVLPATADQVALEAELEDGGRIRGESSIGRSGPAIRRVHLVPPDVRPLDEALAAIADADLVVLGPGSLYTSVIPNLLVPGVAEAVRQSPALKAYVCNIMTEQGETQGYTAADHVQAVLAHGGAGVVNYCLANTQNVPDALVPELREHGTESVGFSGGPLPGVEMIGRPLLGEDATHHDTRRLATELMRLLLVGQRRLARFPWDLYLWRERVDAMDRSANPPR